jgi:hypothetical protein
MKSTHTLSQARLGLPETLSSRVSECHRPCAFMGQSMSITIACMHACMHVHVASRSQQDEHTQAGPKLLGLARVLHALLKATKQRVAGVIRREQAFWKGRSQQAVIVWCGQAEVWSGSEVNTLLCIFVYSSLNRGVSCGWHYPLLLEQVNSHCHRRSPDVRLFRNTGTGIPHVCMGDDDHKHGF